MEPEGQLQCSQKAVTGYYPDLDVSSLRDPNTFP
jgi:hypothetical protein